MTNFERIKAMPVEKMAGLINDKVDSECSECPASDYCAASTLLKKSEQIRSKVRRAKIQRKNIFASEHRGF